MNEGPILRKETLVNLAVLIVALGSLYLTLRVWGPDEMRAWIDARGVWAPLAIVAIKASTIIIAPIGGGFLYPLAGGLFGFWKAFGLVVVGDAIGGAVAFWISRRFGKGIAERLLGTENGLIAHVLETISTVRGFLITRLLLITHQDLIAYTAGLSKLSFVPFLLIHVFVGMIPAAILTALGNTLLENPSGSTLGLLFAGFGAVGAISFLGFMWFTKKDLFQAPPKDQV